jgi:hypothetical protein
MVSRFVRVCAAVALQNLKELLEGVWAFSVAFDSATVESTSYFDVRARFTKGENLHCLHLFCLPIFGPHTGEYMFQVFKKAMDVICPSWTSKLLAITSDGAGNMMGRIKGIVSHISGEITR